MSKSLESQLDDVASYISKYWDLRSRLTNRLGKTFDLLLLVVTSRGMPVYDPVTGKTNEINKPAYQLLATEDEKQTVFFKAFISDYPLNAIASDVESRFPEADYGKLQKLHEVKKTKNLNFKGKEYLGLVLAGASLIVKTVPKSVVESTIKIPYDKFEVYLFYISMAILAYLLPLVALQWHSYTKATNKHRFIGEVLQYIAIKNEGRAKRSKHEIGFFL